MCETQEILTEIFSVFFFVYLGKISRPPQVTFVHFEFMSVVLCVCVLFSNLTQQIIYLAIITGNFSYQSLRLTHSLPALVPLPFVLFSFSNKIISVQVPLVASVELCQMLGKVDT